MNKISVTAILVLLLVGRAAPAQDDGQRIAEACAADAARLCQVPLPTASDFRRGGIIYNCLQSHVASSDLSRACWQAIMGGR